MKLVKCDSKFRHSCNVSVDLSGSYTEPVMCFEILNCFKCYRWVRRWFFPSPSVVRPVREQWISKQINYSVAQSYTGVDFNFSEHNYFYKARLRSQLLITCVQLPVKPWETIKLCCSIMKAIRRDRFKAQQVARTTSHLQTSNVIRCGHSSYKGTQ